MVAQWSHYRVAQGILLSADDNAVLLVGNRVEGQHELRWTLPGGRAEQGEALTTTLVREFAEETGLQVVLQQLAYVAEARSEEMQKLYLTCAFTVRLLDEAATLSAINDPAGVVTMAQFVPISQVRQFIPSPSLGQPLQEYLAARAELHYWLFPEYMRDEAGIKF